MEDPWVSGSAWATPSKPAERPGSPLSSPPAVAQSPPSQFDVSDPWGISTAALETPNKSDPEPSWTGSGPHGSPKLKAETVGTPGWGGGWGASESVDELEIGGGISTRPTAGPQDSPDWSFSGGAGVGSEDSPPVEMPLEDDVDDDQAQSIPAPPSPPPGLGLASPVRDDFTFNSLPVAALSPPDLGTINLPTSPSFGDEFGGFSSGFGDDPWDAKKQDNGWGESSRRSSSASLRRRESANEPRIDDTGSDDGWGGAASRSRNDDVTAQRQGGMDEEWEEAQTRIRVTEERAVSPIWEIAREFTADWHTAKRKDRQATDWVEGPRCQSGWGPYIGRTWRRADGQLR